MFVRTAACPLLLFSAAGASLVRALVLERRDLVEDAGEPVAELGEAVFHARWNLGVRSLLENAEAHELAQAFVQHLRGESLDAVRRRQRREGLLRVSHTAERQRLRLQQLARLTGAGAPAPSWRRLR